MRTGNGVRDGIPGQSVEVYRLRVGLYLHRGRTTFLPRQAVQERTQTLQDLQGKAHFCSGCSGCWASSQQNRDPDDLLAVRQGNYCPVQTNPRTARFLPGMFSAAEADSRVGLMPV